MANKQISELTAAGTITGAELLHIIQDGNSRKVSIADVLAGLSLLPQLFSGALLARTSNLTSLTVGNTHIVPWQDDTYDTDSWWGGVGNPTRLVVPSGVTKVRLTGGLDFNASSTAHSVDIGILQNGASVPGGSRTVIRQGTTGSTANRHHLSTPALPCAAGDYFELWFSASAVLTQVSASVASFFAIEAAEFS